MGTANLMKAMCVAALFLLMSGALTGCGAEQSADAAPTVPWVRTFTLTEQPVNVLSISGTLQAHQETPLAFRVAGQVMVRKVQAGARVKKDALLLELDPADLDEAVRVVEAEQAAAQLSLATAQADLQRAETLRKQTFASEQAVERAELTVREAQARLDAANSRLKQARNARGYAELRALADGTVVEVLVETGQVVAAGQVVARLAHAGPQEVEVYLSDRISPPASGRLYLPSGDARQLALVEVAGSTDPLSRTRRARYRLAGDSGGLALGSVLNVQLLLEQANGGQAEAIWEVPIAALDERGDGPRLWRFQDGQLKAAPVRVHELRAVTALVSGDLQPGQHFVALGAHLLRDGMTVREQTP